VPGKKTIKEAIKETLGEVGDQSGERTSLTIATGAFYQVSPDDTVIIPEEVYVKGELYIAGELLIV